MVTLTIQPKNKKELTLAKKVLKALDIEFNENKTTYKPDFVASIKHIKQKTVAL